MNLNFDNHLEHIAFLAFFLFSVILHTFNSEEIQCPNYKPILISKECRLDFCTNEQFNTSECEIANPIIKTQRLNNIISFGEKNYRFLAFGTYSNGNMIIETTSCLKSRKRIFYGLKKNGKPFFKNNITNEETSFYSINVKSDNYYQLEIDGLVIKLSGETNNGKEYFFSMSKLQGLVEIFDFDNNTVYSKQIKDFTSIKHAITKRHAIIPLYNTSSEYYYLIAFIGTQASSSSSSTINPVYFQKHIFNSIENLEEINDSNIKTADNGYNKGISVLKLIQKK